MSIFRKPNNIIVFEDTPSRSLEINEIIVGDRVEQSYSFDQKQREYFSRIANDNAQIHKDLKFSISKGYTNSIIQGLCLVTRFSRLIGMYLPGENSILESITFKFHNPTYQDQKLNYIIQVNRIQIAMKVVRLNLIAISGSTVHIAGEAQCVLK
jgi:3-hydroxybutyryl-CoA dehydratase